MPLTQRPGAAEAKFEAASRFDAPTPAEALPEQPGLKVERDRGFVPVLVIEYARRMPD